MSMARSCLRFAAFGGAPPAAPDHPDPWQARRDHMVTDQIESRAITHPATLAAMRRVPRHRFVPEDLRTQAYDDRPLPIDEGQTISQPYIVAFMTEQIAPTRTTRVLEIGTGSGYQTAILAEICAEVFTLELHPRLAAPASRLLAELGYQNIRARTGDGGQGWPEAAPFDAILVTAAAESVPPTLLHQLKDGGRLIIPLGPPGGAQELVLVTKQHGRASPHRLIPVRFVPFVRPYSGLS